MHKKKKEKGANSESVKITRLNIYGNKNKPLKTVMLSISKFGFRIIDKKISLDIFLPYFSILFIHIKRFDMKYLSNFVSKNVLKRFFSGRTTRGEGAVKAGPL